MRKNFVFPVFCVFCFVLAFYMGRKSSQENAPEAAAPSQQTARSQQVLSEEAGKSVAAGSKPPVKAASEKKKALSKADIQSLLKNASGQTLTDQVYHPAFVQTSFDKEFFDTLKERFREELPENKPAAHGKSDYQVQLASRLALIKGVTSAVAKKGYDKADVANLIEFLQWTLLQKNKTWLEQRQALNSLNRWLPTIPYSRRDEIMANVDPRAKHLAPKTEQQLFEMAMLPQGDQK